MSNEEISMFNLHTGKTFKPGDPNFEEMSQKSDALERARILLSDDEKKPEHTKMTTPERGGIINLAKVEKSEPEPRVSQIVPPAEKPPTAGSMDQGAAG